MYSTRDREPRLLDHRTWYVRVRWIDFCWWFSNIGCSSQSGSSNGRVGSCVQMDWWKLVPYVGFSRIKKQVFLGIVFFYASSLNSNSVWLLEIKIGQIAGKVWFIFVLLLTNLSLVMIKIVLVLNLLFYVFFEIY